MRVAVDLATDLEGLAELLAGLARVNVNDMLREPKLLALAEAAIDTPGAIAYTRDEDEPDAADGPADRWSSWAAIVEAQKDEPGPWRMDCEDATALLAAVLTLRPERRIPSVNGPLGPVRTCVTQPEGSSLGHAWVGDGPTVRDLAADSGMPRPPATFYRGPTGSAEV